MPIWCLSRYIPYGMRIFRQRSFLCFTAGIYYLCRVMKRIIVSLAALVFVSAAALKAEIRLPAVIGDNMVIQRDTRAALWGTAVPGRKVTVSPSWLAHPVTTVADMQTGKWTVRVQTPSAGGPHTITFSDGTPLTITGVLAGDVWFCSGQSNMEMPMRGFDSQPVEGSTEHIVKAKPSRNIRMHTVKKCSSPVVQESSQGRWECHTPDEVARTSAVAYFFADLMEEVLEVPVGLIITDWGGSTIEAWMNRGTLDPAFRDEFSFGHLDDPSTAKKYDMLSPCLLWNGQVAPLVPFTFKGMLWYQGESNFSRPDQYVRLQTAYVKMMREEFQVPDAPFYFVQIAPYKYSPDNNFNLGFLLEAQDRTVGLIPNSGMAVTVDAGEENTIHPRFKKTVGRRLALLALQNTFGMTAVDADAPRYRSVEFRDGKAYVAVDMRGGRGLSPMRTDISEGFEVAGADKKFHKAVARCGLKGLPYNVIEVRCDEVSEPVAVRYCFRCWSRGTVCNDSGIPLAPFRTDNWNNIVK